MISRSDLVILVVASGALAVGSLRWHQSTQDVSTITIPANSRVIAEPIQNTPATPASTTIANAATSTSAVNQVRIQTIAAPIAVPEIVVEAEPAKLGSHNVRSGDYLGKIAQQYGTDIQTLRDLNNISGSLIEIGDQILYPL